jgi:hypothetical protein|tara:strand:+ start:113 stop:715 length:603 start_codon:yes stop_codon:yes gene_type:complete
MSQIKLKHSGGNGVIIAAPSSNPAADRTITLPDLSGNITLPTTNGITQADAWVMNSSYDTNGVADITSNLTRHSAGLSGLGNIGSAMTQSSGIFTFPITGIYLVMSQALFRSEGGARSAAGVQQLISIDSGSNFNISTHSWNNGYINTAYVNSTAFGMYDVTNTSTFQIKFRTNVTDTMRLFGESDKMNTGFTFVRLGDT